MSGLAPYVRQLQLIADKLKFIGPSEVWMSGLRFTSDKLQLVADN